MNMYKDVWIYVYRVILIYKCTDVRIYGYMYVLWLCEYVNIWIHGYIDLRICDCRVIYVYGYIENSTLPIFFYASSRILYLL